MTTATIDETRGERLPKWAQRELRILRMQLAEACGRIAGEVVGADTIADPYGEPPRPLGNSTLIRFQTQDQGKYFQVSLKDDALYLYASDIVLIEPASSNTFQLHFTARLTALDPTR